MAAKPATEYVTNFHERTTREVRPNSRVLFVGKDTRGLLHRCSVKKASMDIRLEKPAHFALPASYCAHCDILYVGTDEDPHGSAG